MNLDYVYNNLKEVIAKYIFGEFNDEEQDRFEMFMDIDVRLLNLTKHMKNKVIEKDYDKQQLLTNWIALNSNKKTDTAAMPSGTTQNS